jgi:hypothetical protein
MAKDTQPKYCPARDEKTMVCYARTLFDGKSGGRVKDLVPCWYTMKPCPYSKEKINYNDYAVREI